ncbi:MAG: hypothetical protein NVSMB21_12660 [Vulcanimicrobiaceae bacterium]
MKMNSEFVDLLLRAFGEEDVRYLVIGAHAVAYHARPRATHDFDLWIANDAENARRTYRALARFGAPLDRLMVAELESDDLIFQIGIAPIRIENTAFSGVSFEEAWPNRVPLEQRVTGRLQDLADLERLEADR